MRKARLVALLAVFIPTAVSAGTYSLTVDKVAIDTGEFQKQGIGYNGASPGPVLRFQEGEKVTINVTNNLDVTTSVHWHGLILPFQQDGVPTISYDGIKPGETFRYEFPIVQAGTYWYHSHSGFQEPDGAYGAIVIEPRKREPFRYDRDYVVQLTDSHPHDGDRIMRNLKNLPDYYNRQLPTLGEFFGDAAKNGLGAAIDDRMAWGRMRMSPADIEETQGFTPLINGKGPEQNWTGLFKPGERIRLRFINSSAMTYFDIRIPGLKMLVVNADGNNIQPVMVDEFRIAVAETYDVIVNPSEDKAFTIFAASMGRSAFARETLAPRQELEAAVPRLEQRLLLTMGDMSMADEGAYHDAMVGMKHGAAKQSEPAQAKTMDHSKMGKMTGPKPMKMDHSKMPGMEDSDLTETADPFYAPGSGLAPKAFNGGKFLSYMDLKAQRPLFEHRKASREIELRLTGNMQRYIWSINGKKYEDEEEIRLRYGERVRFKFVNETMMSHPMHLHGMWSILDTGAGKYNPAKHTISIAPGTTVEADIEADATGRWAFHCHLMFHMASGMFREVTVVRETAQVAQ